MSFGGEELRYALDTVCCSICLCVPRDAHVCPVCAGVACLGCIQTWYSNRRPNLRITQFSDSAKGCPICRGFVGLDRFVRVPWIDALARLLQPMLPESSTVWCADHPHKVASLFCIGCKIDVCVECALWGSHYFHDVKAVGKASEEKGASAAAATAAARAALEDSVAKRQHRRDDHYNQNLGRLGIKPV